MKNIIIIFLIFLSLFSYSFENKKITFDILQAKKNGFKEKNYEEDIYFEIINDIEYAYIEEILRLFKNKIDFEIFEKNEEVIKIKFHEKLITFRVKKNIIKIDNNTIDLNELNVKLFDEKEKVLMPLFLVNEVFFGNEFKLVELHNEFLLTNKNLEYLSVDKKIKDKANKISNEISYKYLFRILKDNSIELKNENKLFNNNMKYIDLLGEDTSVERFNYIVKRLFAELEIEKNNINIIFEKRNKFLKNPNNFILIRKNDFIFYKDKKLYIGIEDKEYEIESINDVDIYMNEKYKEFIKTKNALEFNVWIFDLVKKFDFESNKIFIKYKNEMGEIRKRKSLNLSNKLTKKKTDLKILKYEDSIDKNITAGYIFLPTFEINPGDFWLKLYYLYDRSRNYDWIIFDLRDNNGGYEINMMMFFLAISGKNDLQINYKKNNKSEIEMKKYNLQNKDRNFFLFKDKKIIVLVNKEIDGIALPLIAKLKNIHNVTIIGEEINKNMYRKEKFVLPNNVIVNINTSMYYEDNYKNGKLIPDLKVKKSNNDKFDMIFHKAGLYLRKKVSDKNDT